MANNKKNDKKDDEGGVALPPPPPGTTWYFPFGTAAPPIPVPAPAGGQAGISLPFIDIGGRQSNPGPKSTGMYSPERDTRRTSRTAGPGDQVRKPSSQFVTGLDSVKATIEGVFGPAGAAPLEFFRPGAQLADSSQEEDKEEEKKKGARKDEGTSTDESRGGGLNRKGARGYP